MPNLTITQLPAAGPITGSELVPIVQNGQTLRTTTAALAGSPVQTQTFLTLNQEPTLINSRALSGGTGIGLVDGGALSTLQVTLNGASGSLEVAGNGLIVKTGSGSVTGRSISVSGVGLSIANGSGVTGNPTLSLTGLIAAIAQVGGTGLLAIQSGTTAGNVLIAGTADEIDVVDGNGFAGNPTISLAPNPVIPGTAGIVIPNGTDAQEPAGIPGQFRYNTTTETFDGYSAGSWKSFAQSGVATVTATSPISSSGGLNPNISLNASYGDTQNPYASKTANYVLAAPNGSAGLPTFRAIVAADIPTLNQNTTGTAANVTGIVAIANGGTNASDAATALTNLGAYPNSNPSGYTANTGTVTSVTGGSYLTGGTITTSGTLAVDATSSNTASKVVARDASGNFSAGTITAALSGNASSATNLAAGATNQIPYQTGSGATTFAVAPTVDNTFLKWSSSGGFAWEAVEGAGTVTSIDVSGGTTGLTTSGGPITSSGTITLAGTLAVANGGTGATTAGGALTSLGAYPASNPSGYTSNAGTVTSVTGGSYLTGGTITTSGTLAVDATSANTASKVVARDASGDFSAGTITAALSGNATTATTAGNVSGTVAIANGGTGATSAGGALTSLGAYPASNPSGYTSNTGTVTSVTGGSYLTGGTITTSGTLAVDATSANTASKVVARDASGNFSAGTITAALSGTASSATNLAAGATNQIPYQTGSGATTFAVAPTVDNTFLKWSSSGGFAWETVGAAGTVTSIDVSGGTTGLTTSGGPITSSGTITLAGTLAIANGGTGATSAANALTNLGAVAAAGGITTISVVASLPGSPDPNTLYIVTT